MQDLIIRLAETVILALNQMTNATFNCECTVDDACGQPFWSIENEGNTFVTNYRNHLETIAQRGITFSSANTTAVISIPDTAENNNTLISCGAFLFGGNDFSASVEVLIIGESE